MKELTERRANIPPSPSIDILNDVSTPVHCIHRSAQASPIHSPKGIGPVPSDEGSLHELRIANQGLARENEALKKETEQLRRSRADLQHPLKQGPSIVDQRVMAEASSHLQGVKMALKGLCEYRTRMQARSMSKLLVYE